MFTYGRYVSSLILGSNNEKALTKLYETSHKSYCICLMISERVKQDKLDSINAQQCVVIISDELLVIFRFLFLRSSLCFPHNKQIQQINFDHTSRKGWHKAIHHDHLSHYERVRWRGSRAHTDWKWKLWAWQNEIRIEINFIWLFRIGLKRRHLSDTDVNDLRLFHGNLNGCSCSMPFCNFT